MPFDINDASLALRLLWYWNVTRGSVDLYTLSPVMKVWGSTRGISSPFIRSCLILETVDYGITNAAVINTIDTNLHENKEKNEHKRFSHRGKCPGVLWSVFSFVCFFFLISFLFSGRWSKNDDGGREEEWGDVGREGEGGREDIVLLGLHPSRPSILCPFTLPIRLS